MKKLFKFFISFLIFIVLFLHCYIYAYSTDKYEMTFPSSFEEVAENVFTNTKGTSFNIQISKNNSITAYPYTQENLNELVENLKESFSDTKYVQEIVNSLIKNYNLKLTEDNIKTVSKSFKFNIEKKEITTFSKNEYKCFDIVFKGSLEKASYYLSQYYIFTKDNIFVITVSSNSIDYFNSYEFKNIINSFTIKNYQSISDELDIYNSDFYINLLVNLVITILVYCAVPTILRIKNGKYDYQKGHKIIIINNVIVWLIFIIIKSSQGITTASGAAILYYWVNKAILLKPKHDKDSEESKEYTFGSESSNSAVNKDIVDKNIKIKENKKYCTSCGEEVKESWAFCNNCGNKLK